jgi:AcrR family transcriptional regulator
MPASKRTRRTQEERREGTIRKLLDAATETLIDDGYAAASVQVICKRAGVSQGALFRHFATREALMVAVGDDVAKKTLGHYAREFEALRDREESLVLAMRLVRSHCRSRQNQAWFELVMAARTSASLRKALRPAMLRYYADIDRLARALLPDLAAILGDNFSVLVETIVAVFDGETMQRVLVKKPNAEGARLELLGALASLVAAKRP